MEIKVQANKWATINGNIYEKDWHINLPPEDSSKVLEMTAICRIPIIGFDLESLKGKKVKKAKLRLGLAGNKAPVKLDITSISQDWSKEEATLIYSSKGKNWAVDKWFTDVVMGNGNSFHEVVDVDHDNSQKIIEMDLPLDFVYAMITAQSFGLGLIDEKSQPYKDGSRDLQVKFFNVDPEEGILPELLIEYEEADFDMPEGVSSLSAEALFNEDSFDHTSVKLSWVAGEYRQEDYLYFNIYVSQEETDIQNMKKLDKFFVPLFQEGKKDYSTEIEYLKPETDYIFAVTTSNGSKESEPVYVKVKTKSAVQRPELIEFQDEDDFTKGAVLEEADYNIYFLDDISKVNPVNGNVLELNLEDYLKDGSSNISNYKNYIFDGNKVVLSAAANEKLGLKMLVESKKDGMQQFSVSIKSEDDKCNVALNKVWYLKCEDVWYPEVAIPMKNKGDFEIPFKENEIPGQRFQEIFLDMEIAENCEPGEFNVEIEVTNGDCRSSIPVIINVLDITLQETEFGFELNGYLPPYRFMGYEYGDQDYDLVEEAYYETAYRHNTHINILPYTQYGKVFAGCAPKVEYVDGQLRVTDWSDWDASFRRYIEGTYLEEKMGRKVPITHLYLPFHENWPVPVDEFLKLKIESQEYPNMINEYALKSEGLENDFAQEYRDNIKSVMKDFIRHFDENGWNHVEFLFYTNNKHYSKIKNHLSDAGRDPEAFWSSYEVMGNDGKGTAWWILEEQVYPSDFKATAYYGEILKEAQRELNSGWNIKYRSDISRYHHIFDYLDDCLDVVALNLKCSEYLVDRARKRRRELSERYWVYGGHNKINEPNISVCAWIIRSYVNGADRMLPWNNFGVDKNYEEPGDVAVLYPGNRFGLKEPVVSLRLKTIRKGMEIQKYLEMLRKAFGYNDIQLKEYVKNFIDVKGENKITHMDDAGYAQFANIRNQDLERLRKHIQMVVLSQRD